MKFVKAGVLIAVGIKLLSLFGRDVHEWATDFISRHGIDSANRFVETTLEKLEGVSNTQIVTFSTIAFCYSGLLLTEGIGLWLQKRWAEYLTAIATSLFIPLELYEIYERFTWVRIAILVLNVFIVWYLATRLTDEKREVATETTDGSEKEKVRVKICGITNLEDAIHAVEAGADELGFNFYKDSPRYIAPPEARKIVDSLPKAVKIIGVFVNESLDELLQITKHVGLDGIQLHGDEDQIYIRDLKKKTDRFVIKAFRVSPRFEVSDAMDWPINHPLFDAYSLNERGGTGRTIDWENAATDIYLLFPYQAYLAGGLTPENVGEAIRSVDLLYAVDVASGVASSPGKKDTAKVAAFIKAAKEAL